MKLADIEYQSSGYLRDRAEIDAEINDRQEAWKPATAESIATHEEGEQVRERSSAAAGAGMDMPPPQVSDSFKAVLPADAVVVDEPEPEATAPLEEKSEEEFAVVETKGVEPEDTEMKRKVHKYRLVYKSVFYKPPAWDEDFTDKVKVFLKDGYYHISVGAAGYLGLVYPPVVVENFLAQVDCQFVGRADKMTKCGMVFGVNKAGGFISCCAIYITKDGLYCVAGERGDKPRLILFWEKSEHIRQSEETNTLMAAKVGKKITIWINGHDVASVGDDWFTSGCVGIFAACPSVEPEGHVRFRNFEVYAIE